MQTGKKQFIILINKLTQRDSVFESDSIRQRLNNFCPDCVIDVGVADSGLIENINTNIRNAKTQIEEDTNTERYLRTVIDDAIKAEASDIHIIVTHEKCYIKFRILGEPKLYAEPSHREATTLCRALYTKASPDSKDPQYDTSLAQDAVIELRDQIVPLKLRYNHVQIFPEGFKVVLRLIPLKPMTLTIDQMGYSAIQAETLKRITTVSTGLVIFAGKTNSGKSTTVTALLQETKNQFQAMGKDLMIEMVENPPEYVVEGVVKIPVRNTLTEREKNLGIKSGWGAAMRALLRQDNDVLGIGEIRDPESAELLV